jgi:hypothetical protein
VVDTRSPGWRVLQALLDEVTADSLESGERAGHLQILGTKFAASDG